MFLARTALALSLLAACNGDKATDEEDALAGTTLSVHPPVGGQGQSIDVTLSASQSFFEYGGSAVDFGEGITVESLTVQDGWEATARIAIDADAALGMRDVGLTIGTDTRTLEDSFEVIDQSFSISPDTAKMGETIDVDILGANTEWTGGVTWPYFGDDITVVDFSVLSPTLATATVSVSADAVPGARNVTMDNGGGDLVVLYDGFHVDRVALAAAFDPSEAEQGETVDFTITARDTNFLADTPDLAFFDTWGENPDIVVDSITVLDAQNLYGRMTLSNAASLGMRDVLLTTDGEGVLIEDAFEVVSGDWNLEEVAISLRYYVQRAVDNSTGAVSESVVAYCMFYIPLDPPCPSSSGSGSGSGSLGTPDPYDNNGVWSVTGEGSSDEGEDCPTPTTIGAGDYVWLESPANTITLERYEDSSSGAIYYINTDLTMDDYIPNNWYDLHTQGEDGGIGEYLLEEVQPTVPADWQWLTPSLWGNYTHDRSEDFAFTWTPAQTYPDAIFFVELFDYYALGPMAEESYYGYAAVYPWDDGEHAFTADEVGQFAAGGVPVTAYSYIEGPEFGLPESIYQENTAPSWILYSMYMVLE
jgi:hypothetical protein